MADASFVVCLFKMQGNGWMMWCCDAVWLQVRCWEVQDNGQTVPKAQQMHAGPVLDVCWSDVRFPWGFVC